VIPIRDHNPVSRRIVIVPVLVAINIVVFLFVQPTLRTFGDDSREAAVEQTVFVACTASIPYEVTHGRLVADAPGGAVRGRIADVVGTVERARCPDKNVWLSLLASMFLHGGLLHIGGNMLFLIVFGNNIEDHLGATRFTLFYLLCGVAATYGQALVNPNSAVPLVGASGAIAGVLGAYLLLYPRARVTTLVIVFFFITSLELPAAIVLGLWLLIQVFQGVGSVTGSVGGVAYFAHLAGFLAGAILIKTIFAPGPARRRLP